MQLLNILEYNRNIPVVSAYDTVVIGSGPAGICAAVASARGGARTLLVERLGAIGGNLTLGEICPILGSVSKGTMADEVKALLAEGHDAPEHITHNGVEFGIDATEAKEKLTAFVASAGVTFLPLTAFIDTMKEGDHVTGVILSAQSGLFAVVSKVVIDATGDGAVAAAAGAEYSVGRDDGSVQPCSLEFTLDGVDESIAITAWGGSDPVKIPGTDKEYRVLCREKCEEGELPANVTIVRLHRTLHAGERTVNATQHNGLDPLDPFSVGRAEVDLRGQIGKCVEFLRKYIPGYENCRLKGSASYPGVRESRRITGDDTVCDADVEEGRKRPDAVVHDAWFLIDIHNPKGGGQAEGHAHDAKPYDIPYGSLLVRGLEGILTCGRCISGTHRAHASYRVMTVCMATGEAVGTAAALAVKAGITPRQLGAEPVISSLVTKGVCLK